MGPRWKLLVEGLGVIERAEVEVRPLMLFVGANNAGKTELASLMWGLLSRSGVLPLARGEAFQRCVAWIEERFARREQKSTFDVPPDVHAALVQIVNDTLREQGKALAETTFNRSGFKVGRIELCDVAHREDGPLGWRDLGGGWLSTPQDSWRVPARNASEREDLVGVLAWHRALGGLPAIQTLRYVSFSPRDPLAPVFLPASRTGFMLFYRSLTQQIVGDSLRKTSAVRAVRAPVPDLTEPVINFLDLLMSLQPETVGAYPEEAAFLERAMGGRLHLRSSIGLPEVLYEHTEGEPPIPMNLSSSLVTELAPVVLTLRHVRGYRVLIIEEPEAHLHPKLQRHLARTIVRLIRKGLYVWITTHSENLCQQINNFIHIGESAQRADLQKKLGYEEGEYLTLDDVSGYGFTLQGGTSQVAALRRKKAGLVMPTFNREIMDLSKETMFLDEATAGER